MGLNRHFPDSPFGASDLRPWASTASSRFLPSEALLEWHRLQTGREFWRTGGVKESWPTPVVATRGGTSELFIAMQQKIIGLDPATGEVLWECDSGIQWYMCPTTVVDRLLIRSDQALYSLKKMK